MSRQQSNVVYIESGFLQSKELINSKLDIFDLVELRAKDRFIELAIQLAQYFVKEGVASYDKFTSSLTTTSNEETIPQVSIKLHYQPPQKPKEQPETKEYRQRQANYKEDKEIKGKKQVIRDK